MQNQFFDDIGKRTRYYQSMLDTDLLLKGKPYSDLKESYILFICKEDPFQKGLPKYTFEEKCIETPEVELCDFSHKVIYNASAYTNEKDKDLKAFLKFVSCNKSTDDFTDELFHQVQHTILADKFRREYLTMTPHEADIRKESRLEGIEETKIANAKALILLGKLSLEDIASCCNLPLEKVQELAKEAGK